ncbi:MAG: histidine--tRNA ligase [Methanomassiliicoccales archaeon]|jgi:histidyl-tRNA synthetase|nr:histidine--tRNA ligase [Methanomassiliicoccales archaeon]
MIQRPRGTRDFTPDEMEKRRYVESLMRKEAEIFGFREIATPIFEHAELFTMKSGPGILEEMYAFKDKGGRELTLRPELTAPVMRFFVNELTDLPRPLKLYYMGPCFRYERPQSGRFREFYQFGAELIGTKNPESDAEIVSLASSIMKRIGLRDYVVRIGHIGILRDILRREGIDGESASVILQKLDKKMYDDASVLMEERGMSQASIREIIKITKISGQRSVLQELQSFEGDAREYLNDIIEILEILGVENLRVDLGVVRGLDYYTGMVFEIEVPGLGAEKQVCGGGSYSLAELFGGEKVFSTGFAIGFDRTLIALEKQGIDFPRKRVDVYVIPLTDGLRKKAFEISARLRDKGISTDIDLMRRSLQKNLKYAASIGVRYAAIIGEREAEQGIVILRNMDTGEQTPVAMIELPEWLACARGTAPEAAGGDTKNS